MLRLVKVRTGDKVLEFEITDDEARSVLGLDTQLEPRQVGQIGPAILQDSITEDNIHVKDSRVSDTINFRKRQYTLLFQTDAEIIGRKEQSRYCVYQCLETSDLLGVIISKSHKARQVVTLGSPTNTNSVISIIMKAIKSMPFYEEFTRRDVYQLIPGYIGRGHLMKFAFDYMIHLGEIERLNEKDVERKSILYRRKVNRDEPDSKLGQEAARLISK